MQDEAININDNFWAISTLQNNKKLYITCLQYSYSISLHFPYNIIYLSDRCEAITITFVLPSNNGLNVDSIMEPMENKLDFNRSYCYVRQCGTLCAIMYFISLYELSRGFAHYFFIWCTELTQLCSSLGSLVFTHLGGIKRITHLKL